jgi:hypothetical protein
MLLAGAIVPANAAADSTIAVISDQEAENVVAADQEAEDLVAPSEEDLLSAQAIEGDLSFIDQDGTTQTLSGSDFKADLAQVSGDSVTLKDGLALRLCKQDLQQPRGATHHRQHPKHR